SHLQNNSVKVIHYMNELTEIQDTTASAVIDDNNINSSALIFKWDVPSDDKAELLMTEDALNPLKIVNLMSEDNKMSAENVLKSNAQLKLPVMAKE
ncbi:hypothetical protein FQN50_007402, partial [Emmonsiellopsis sp. PD_5]